MVGTTYDLRSELQNRNKNAFQRDAYRPLVDRIPACTVAMGVPAWGHVLTWGVYLPGGCTCPRGCTSPGVYLPGGVTAWGCTCPGVPYQVPIPCERNHRHM